VTLPDLEELLTLRAGARSLSLRAHGSARALLFGAHRSTHRGRGLEFEEVRPYVPGDDLRTVDWRVTARRGRMHTKLFREERERPVWLLIDLSGGMFFGSRLQLKSMLAVRAAALLAWVTIHGGDRIGAVIGNSSAIRALPPRSREAGVLPILNTLIEMQPSAPGAPAPDALRRLEQALEPLVHPGSLVLALSDFASIDDVDRERWSDLASHSECRWLWITDPLEERGLPNGRFRVGNLRELLSLDGASVRNRWLAAWRAREERILACTQDLRIALMRLDTSQNLNESLARLMRSIKFAA
jgi:uncharacterized protein (DUF58 family)